MPKRFLDKPPKLIPSKENDLEVVAGIVLVKYPFL
jgi:hypothetical protein